MFGQYEYRGRSFYVGPAVNADEDEGPTLQDVIRATDVTLQWDQMGRAGLVVYPCRPPGRTWIFYRR